MKTVYVQKRVEGLDKLLLYLTGEKVLFNKYYQLGKLSWLTKIEVVGNLGEWNFRRVFEIVNENDLRIEYSSNRLQIFL